MNRNILRALLISFFYSNIASAGITIIGIPETPSAMDDPASISSVSKKIDTTIQKEISDPRAHIWDWEKFAGLTLKEGEKYLKPAVSTRLEGNPNKEQLIQEIFSTKYFTIPAPTSEPPFDVLNPDEKKLESLFLEDDARFRSTLSKILRGYNRINEVRNTIDPRLLMVSGEKIRKLFFQLEGDCSFERYKKCYSTYNTKTERTFEQYLDELFGPDNFGLPQDPEERSKYYLSHPIGFLNQKIITNILIAANRILDLTTPDDNVIIFGNTPYFAGRALQLIAQSDESKKRNIIEFPFSGSPNRAREFWGTHPCDYVTSDRLSHLQQRLRQRGLMSDNPALPQKKTYFVDVIGTGGGIAYTIETILRDFKQNKKEQFPEIEVIALNEFYFKERGHASVASAEGKDGDKIQLTFPSKNDPRFSIDCKVVYLPDHAVLDMAPDQLPEMRIFPKYNAAFWNPEYDYLLTQEHQPHIKIMLEYFDTNVKHLERMLQTPRQSKEIAAAW